MKKVVLKTLLGLSLIITLAFSGCELLENADDVSFDVDQEVTFVVAEAATATNKAYVGKVAIDISNNADIQEYKDKIKKIEVTKIEYHVTGYSTGASTTAVTFTSGSVKYSADDNVANAHELAAMPTLDLKATAQAGTVLELPINTANFDALGQLLLTTNKAFIFTTGTLSSTPVSFNVPTKFYLKVTANALD